MIVASQPRRALDPVTFEVLRHAFATTVDQMSEQILRTCHSFVMWSRDFSCALHDASGNTVMQGSQDIAVHVGTMHFTCQAIIAEFGDDMHEGDVYVMNDPYRGNAHLNDMRLFRPIFHQRQLIGFAVANGHWADVGGAVPGSFDIRARDHFAEGIRVTPVRLWDSGQYRSDVAKMIVSNTRAADDAQGDLLAQAEATRVGERELLRLVDRYGCQTIIDAMAEVQDYVERLMRKRVARLPDGTWEAEDYMDLDPSKPEGLIPIKVKMTIAGEQISYDLSGSHPVVGSFMNSAFGMSYSGVYGGTKMFFPDIPLNSGFYRVVDVELGPESCVNAPWPVAVTGFASGPYEKIVGAIFQLWSEIIPDRAIACSFNLEYLLVGGRDLRGDTLATFMWYDWMVGGWGGRNGLDGASATAPLFGVGLAVQPLEGQERLSPVLTTGHELLADSGGPGRWRGGLGVEKGGTLTQADHAVMSYMCDRSRSITYGIRGGLPSLPHGVSLTRRLGEPEFLGAAFSGVHVHSGDTFVRPSAGGGGYGDPLLRDPMSVAEDLADDYVTLARALTDYGVVAHLVDADLRSFEVDEDETARMRAEIAAGRRARLAEDPAKVAERYRRGEIDVMDAVRIYGVVLDWGTGTVLTQTTADFRQMLESRMVAYWSPVAPPGGAVSAPTASS